MILSGVMIIVFTVILGLASLVGGRFSAGRPAYLEFYLGEQKRAFEGEIVDGMTVLDAVSAAALAGNLIFKYTVDPLKNETSILAIDGYDRKEDPGKTTVFYLNSEKVESGKLHTIVVKPGDMIMVRIK